jgi:phosphate-selective porin OprO/OprP
MRTLKVLSIAAAVVVPCAVFPATVRADDATPTQSEREKQLESRVDELEKQLTEVTKKLADSGASKAGDELEARVAELEKLSKKDKEGLFGYWSNGIRMDSADGQFKLKMGGRIQNDWSWFQHTSPAEGDFGTQIEAGEEFRRARLYMAGQIYSNVEFMAEYDFAGGTVVPRDVWIALKGLPVGMVQVGNFKAPTSTEQLTSDLFIPFMERSSSDDAFSPGYQAGMMVSNTFMEDRGCYELAVTRNTASNGNSTGNSKSGEYNLTGRLAGQPWICKDGDRPQYMTAGLAGSLHSPAGDALEYRSRPELHLAPYFVDTGSFAADKATLIEADSGFICGPFWAYGDYFYQWVSPQDMHDVRFEGWSVSTGWFITGESKVYKASNATFDRISPKHNFDGKGGMGAWEVAARFDQLNLNDGDISGGRQENFTLGLSWYINPNTRVMLDWVHAIQKSVDTWINGLEMRFQIDF